MPSLAIPKLVEYVLDAAKELAPDEWDGSLDDEPIDEVDVVDGGINQDTFWCKTRFTHEGATHLLEAKSPVQKAGQRGGGDTIKIDGVEMEKADLVFRPIFYRFRLRISITYKFEQNGKPVRYRFDGSVG